MRSKHLLIPILLLSGLTAFAQKNLSVAGTIADSTGKGLPAATVVLLQQEDSLLVSFGITDNDGNFLLRRVGPGSYILQATYVGYETYSKSLVLEAETGKTEVGTIALNPAVTGLATVEVSSERVPMQFRRDTIEYNAEAFKTQPGSVVEDLLKRLPGVEVERDGSIKAQGKQVQNVLVDGKEFFGKDPSIATKNLPADAVNKVQVYDKKSEMAEFTGIEDGLDEKTINLMLKDEKKQGYFGNVSAGYGLDERFAGKFSINRFSTNNQLSAIGMGNNTNEAGFSFQDYLRFMGGLSNLMSGGGGGIRISMGDGGMGIPMGMGMGSGVSTTWAGGINYNQDFSKKTRLNASYFLNRIENVIDRELNRENLLGDRSFRSFEDEERLSRNFNHRVNLTFRTDLDSFQNIVLRSRVGVNDAHQESDGLSKAFNTNGLLENQGDRDYFNDGDNLELSTSLSYRRRFRSPGRAFVTDLTFGVNDNSREGSLRSINDYFKNGATSFSENLNQRQYNGDDALNYGATVSYTEPLGKNKYIEAQVSRQNYSNETIKDFYDIRNGSGIFNDSLSRKYNRDYIYDRGGLNFKVNRRKYNITAGAAVQRSLLDGKLDSDSPIGKSYIRLLPKFNLNYEFGPSRNLKVDYRTNLREPSLEQLQPVVDNSDPLNTYTGNPALKPEYAHNLGFHFMLFDQFSFTSFFWSLNSTYVKDRIVNSSTIDQYLRRNVTPLNVDHDLNLNSNLSFSTPLRFIQTNIRLNVSNTWNDGILFVNGAQNNTDRIRNTFGISFDNRKKDKIDASIGVRLSYNKTSYSESPQLNQTYLDKRYFAEITVNPTKKWSFNSIFEYTQYSAESFGASQNIPLWQAGLTRYILKNNRGQIKLTAFDLLDKNLGISRTSQLNYIQEERIVSLGRYVMLGFAYSITGFKGESGGFEIKMHRN